MNPTLAARNAVGVAFIVNGLLFASWASRIPEARTTLGLDNGQLGWLLLAIAAGSVIAMPATGAFIERFGSVQVIRTGAMTAVMGVVLVSWALVEAGLWMAVVGLSVYGVGHGVWDVAMNTAGVAVERDLGRAVMSRFHAGFSLGAVAGAGIGAGAAALQVPAMLHLLPVGAVGLAGIVVGSRRFLPDDPSTHQGPRPSAWSAWGEPRTVSIGLMVLALALAEGTVNDWLPLALVDGYGVERWVGVTGLALFVASLTFGRLVGAPLLDRFGRVRVLWSTMATSAAGVLLVVFGHHPLVVVLGIVLWGLGASLGIPVGISAAADDPRRAAARVSVVSTIGYGAFLTGPPLFGFVADHVGTLNALLVVVVLLIPSAALVPSAREHRRHTAISG